MGKTKNRLSSSGVTGDKLLGLFAHMIDSMEFAFVLEDKYLVRKGLS